MENNTENQIETAAMNSTQTILTNLKKQLAQLPNERAQRQPVDCEICRDTKTVFVETIDFGLKYRLAKECDCVAAKRLAKALQLIPPRYHAADIDTLAPNPALHSKQAAVIAQIKNEPLRSYAFCGTFGTGKTHFYWSLYRAAARANRIVKANMLTGLLSEYRAAIQKSLAGEIVRVSIAAEDLRQTHTKFSLFLDDIDKAKPTEYAAEQLFDLINAAYSYNHQIVWTSNLSEEKLIDHFARADDRFGGAIVRRLIDSAVVVEMF